MNPVRILGIDPGLRHTGFGLIEKSGQKLSYLTSGVIKSGEGELPERLGVLFSGLTETIGTHRPRLAILFGGREAVELVLGEMNDRRRKRHRTGHGAGSKDGLRVGHE